LPVAQASRAAFGDQPGDVLSSFPEELQDPSTVAEDRHRPPPQGEGLFPVSDPVVYTPVVLAPDMGRSPLTFPSTGPASQLDETRGSGFAEAAAAPKPAIEEDFAAARRRRNGWLTLVGACLAVATGLVAYGYSWAPASGGQSNVPPQRAETRPPLQAPPGEVMARSKTTEGRLTGLPSPPSHETDTKVSPGQTAARLALQMATFQGPARAAQALQGFRDAGYQGYVIEVSLRDGRRAFAVFLGPYAELAPAERDLDRARQLPGYGSGRLVQLDPSLRLPVLQP
jgi:hypothetical protein